MRNYGIQLFRSFLKDMELCAKDQGIPDEEATRIAEIADLELDRQTWFHMSSMVRKEVMVAIHEAYQAGRYDESLEESK